MHLRSISGGGGLLALAVALSLVSFTSAAVAQSLVTGRQVKDGSVRSVDLRTDQGVRGADVRDGSLSAEQLSSLPPGPPGNQGGQGLPGLAGLDNFDYEISQPFTVDPKSDAEAQVACTGIPI